MATTMKMWKDKIVLYWDGQLTPREEGAIVYKEMEELRKELAKERDPKRIKVIKIAMSDQAIMAKHYSAVTGQLLPKIHGFAKYNKKFGAFLLSLSQQNLRRVYEQFGQIKITDGYSEVETLKRALSMFKAMSADAVDIKNAADLDKHDSGIRYKVPTLGIYQRLGVVLMTRIPRLPVFVDCGCLSGDTEIKFNRAGGMKKISLARLFYNQEANRGNRRSDIKTQVRSYKGDGIGLHPIQRVVQQGMKKTLLLTLEDGKNIKATPDHEVLTDKGWVPVGRLLAGDLVMVDNLVRHKAKAEKAKPKKYPDKRIAVGKHHPYARYQPSHGGRSGSYLLEIHRAVMEAHLSGVEVNVFVEKTYESADGLVFIDPKAYDIHHKDEDHYNNEISNLEVISGTEHAKLHTKGYKNFKHGEVEFSKVVSVSDAGEEMTYDIVCEDPHRNFVANGMVVHNCGKTYMALVSTENQIKSGMIGKGKTLILGKLATLHSGWLADALKFTDLKVACLWLSSNYKKKEKLKALLQSDADVFLINHEGAKGLKDELVAMRFEKIVVDESTVLKGFHSERKGAKGGVFGRTLMEIATFANWRVVMSGTPAPNGPQDLWGQLKFLDPEGFLIERNFSDFCAKYMELKIFGQKGDKFAPRTWVKKNSSISEIKEIITPLAFRVKLRDVIKDLPERTIIQRTVDMTAAQESHYKKLATEYYTVINNEDISVTVDIALITRFRQITGGFLYDNDKVAHTIGGELAPESTGYGDYSIHEPLYHDLCGEFSDDNPKVKALDDLLEDEIAHTEKVVIFAQYTYEIDMILERYKHFNPVSVYGGNSSKVNIENIQRFNTDESIRIIVLHPRSAAHGVTLTIAHYMIFFSISFSAEEDYQSVKRVERAGQRSAMFIYYLLCKASVDTVAFETLQEKHVNQTRLLDVGADATTFATIRGRFRAHLEEKYPSLKKKQQKRSKDEPKQK